MFGLLVLRNMLQQGGLVSKALVAGLAFVRFVSLMTPGVRLQVGELGEGLGATWMCKSEQKVLIVSCRESSGTIDSLTEIQLVVRTRD